MATMNSHRYRRLLVRLMWSITGINYADDHVFSQEELLNVTPDDIVAFFNLLVFGDKVPPPNAQPTGGRSNTLAFHKKAISHFMPRRGMQWDDVDMRGNPTRSTAVNNLLKAVKKAEVRHQGKASEARRHLEWTEFKNILELIATALPSGHMKQARFRAIITTQWHLCARINDVQKITVENFSANELLPRTLLIKMRWSKNIAEEREAPTQIILGSMDPHVCPLLALAAYLECVLSAEGAGRSSFVFGNGRDGDTFARSILSRIFAMDDFVSSNPDEPLGTHSVRKGVATYAGRAGCSRDHINMCGRWH